MVARARAITLWNYADLARGLGVEPFEVLAQCGLRANALNDPENWIPAKGVLDVLDETARAAARDDFGVLLGESRSFGSLGPLSLLLKHETSLRNVIASLIDYRRLLNDLLSLELDEHGEETLLHWSLVPGLRSSQGINLLATIAYRVLVHGPAIDWDPDCVHFRHAAPNHLAAFNRVFRCRLEFNSDFDGLSFPSRFLDSDNPDGDAELATHARNLLNLLPGIQRPPTTSERARKAIVILLPKGEANVKSVAHSLGQSSRSLHRRLRDEGQTFGGLLNSTRRELVERLLEDSSHPMTTIAELSGFSSVSTFTRWFSLQFKIPPSAWRARSNRNRRPKGDVIGL